SLIRQLGIGQESASEVAARMALDQRDEALALAQSARLTEDRLQLLAIVARKMREQGLTPEPELIESIEQLFQEVEINSLGDRGFKIAADLVFSRPDLAISLVESVGEGPDRERSVDWAFARLSAATAATPQGLT